MRHWQIYNDQHLNERWLDAKYEAIYQYLIDNNIRFRVEYAAIEVKRHRTNIYVRAQACVVTDEKAMMFIKLKFGDEYTIKEIKF